MKLDCETYRERVAADADGVLSPEERLVAQAHREVCVSCRDEHRRQQDMRRLLQGRARRYSAPEALSQRLRKEIGRATPAAVVPLRKVSRRWVIAGSVAALLALMVLPRIQTDSPDLLGVLVQDVRAASTDDARLTIHTPHLDELRAFYASRPEIRFQRAVPDLSALSYRPVGGRVGEVRGTPTTLTVFQGESGKMVCRRFAVGALELPEGGEELSSGRYYTIDGVSVRVVRDGDAICCMAAPIPRHELIRLFTTPHHG